MAGLLADQLRRVKFHAERRWHGIEVAREPHFDSPESAEWFTTELKNASRYLEFGSGGSTYLAASVGVEFATVESDRAFLTAVLETIDNSGYGRPGQVYRWADIGATGRWGRPLGPVSASRERKFRQYSDPPPQWLRDGRAPDLVLVDGRFRVACALKAMRWCIEQGTDATIVFDDYKERQDVYGALEEFADYRMMGRMAILTEWKPGPPGRLDDAIRDAELVWI